MIVEVTDPDDVRQGNILLYRLSRGVKGGGDVFTVMPSEHAQKLAYALARVDNTAVGGWTGLALMGLALASRTASGGSEPGSAATATPPPRA
jgi:hypothetical protein